MSGGRPRTALVHDWLTGMRGGEKVLAAIAERFPASPIYTLFHLPGSVGGELARHPIHTSYLQRLPGLARGYRRYLPLFPAAVEDFDLAGYDLVISSSHCVAKGAIPAPGSRHLCYCHTPVRYAWDQEHAYFPRRRGLVARLRGHLLHRLRQWDVASAARVDRFLANSRFVAERIRRYYRREADVLPPPVATEFFTPGPADAAGGGYALLVSALAPYKRIEIAIAACERLGLELRVVGTGPERARLARLAGGATRLLGAVEGEELRELYRGAALFLQPGTEDFGIAPVEALACGCPVVALARGGVLDIVESGVHGLLYEEAEAGASDPADGLAAAIDKTRGMRFNKLNLRERAEEFSEARFRDRFESLLEPWLSPETRPPAA